MYTNFRYPEIKIFYYLLPNCVNLNYKYIFLLKTKNMLFNNFRDFHYKICHLYSKYYYTFPLL